ncbi:Enhanced ethylene response protein 5-like protein [Drosera capensis]
MNAIMCEVEYSHRQGEGQKRVGALYITCLLFKIYFKFGTVHLCRSVIISIETSRIFDSEEFPSWDEVTYMYYTSHLEVLNENFPADDLEISYSCKMFTRPSASRSNPLTIFSFIDLELDSYDFEAEELFITNSISYAIVRPIDVFPGCGDEPSSPSFDGWILCWV